MVITVGKLSFLVDCNIKGLGVSVKGFVSNSLRLVTASHKGLGVSVKVFVRGLGIKTKQYK